MKVNGTKYWVCDVDTGKRYPANNLKWAKNIRTQCRAVSDLFLEVGTNVVIVNAWSGEVVEDSKLYIEDNFKNIVKDFKATEWVDKRTAAVPL